MWVALLSLLALSSAQAGRVQTLDQQTLNGEIRLTNSALLVTATNVVIGTVPFTNLLAAWFEDQDLEIAGGTGTGLGLLGHYFSSTNPVGPAFARLDEGIEFDWNEEPAPGVARDLFSVIWSGEVEPPVSGPFTFGLVADDNARLYLTNQLWLEVVGRSGLKSKTSDPVTLEAGQRYPIRLHYTDLGGPARVRLLWDGPGIPKGIISKKFLHPSGLNAEHAAQFSTNRGLLATYYTQSEFGGNSFTRIDPTIDFDWSNQDPAPGVARTNFSVRWSGRVRADHTEEYTFYALTDERLRLWIDNRLLIDRPEQGWLSETKESIPLVAGDQYEVRFETRSTGGGAVARLFWSSASIARTNVPASNLSPSKPRNNPTLDLGNKLPPGILLRNGSFIAGAIENASPVSLQSSSGLLKGRALGLGNVARIICQPLSPSLATRIVPGRPGVLLARGDFVDAEFRGLENNRVKVSSVLLGMRSYDAKSEVLVIALRDVNSAGGTFSVRLRDHSQFFPGNLRSDGSGSALQLDDSGLGTVWIPPAEVREIRRKGVSP